MKHYILCIIVLYFDIYAITAQTVYTFTGNGNWTDSINWNNQLVPPNILPSGSEIIISPTGNGECILDKSQVINIGASLTIIPGKKLIVSKNFFVTDQNTDIDEPLSKENIEFLDSIGVPNPTLQQMLGYDGDVLGRPLEDKGIISNLINGMLRDAQSLSGQKTHLYTGKGAYEPSHLGLVYSWGQRNVTQRLPPPCSDVKPPPKHLMCDKYHMKYAVYGTDCSGFIFNLLKAKGINLESISVSQFEERLKFELENHDMYNKLALKNYKDLPIADIKNGDFIKWNGHMGIVSDVGALGKYIFQSNGTNNPGSEAEQKRNLDTVRGVHPISLSRMLSNKFFGKNYQILRLECNLPNEIPGFTFLGDFNDNKYFLSNSVTSWTTANETANSLGGHLATLTSSEENVFVSTNVIVPAWIGLTDEGSEGSFRWVTGESFSYSSWLAGEPNNFNNRENWVHTNHQGLGKWNDESMDRSANYIVEFECK